MWSGRDKRLPIILWSGSGALYLSLLALLFLKVLQIQGWRVDRLRVPYNNGWIRFWIARIQIVKVQIATDHGRLVGRDCVVDSSDLLLANLDEENRRYLN